MKDILLALNIEFEDDLSSDQIELAIRASHGEVKRIFIEARSITCE